jgi:hypothetical protein
VLLGEIEIVLLALLAETTMFAGLDPYSDLGRFEKLSTGSAPVFAAGRVETESVKL